MSSPYDLLTITHKDLDAFKRFKERSKIGIIVHLVLDELPKSLKYQAPFVLPYLSPIEGFEDDFVRGYEVSVDENEQIEAFIRNYVPFFILHKHSSP